MDGWMDGYLQWLRNHIKNKRNKIMKLYDVSGGGKPFYVLRYMYSWLVSCDSRSIQQISTVNLIMAVVPFIDIYDGILRYCAST